MDRICQAAGIRTLNIHGLRHTYASLSLRHGGPPEVVSKQLGHVSVAFTLSRYRTV
ncbi:tyrosine-type recombinase/integrase [Deinococcus irradiatisoli]